MLSRTTAALGLAGATAAVSVAGWAAAVASRWWVVRRTDPQVVRSGPAPPGPGSGPVRPVVWSGPAPPGPGSGPVPPVVWSAGLPAGAEVAVVLGAGLRADGTVTALLARRVEAGVALYHGGVVPRLVMSGAAVGHLDQPAAMARHARSLGVPDEAIELDRRGINTAATCRELAARSGTGPGPAVILVTQEFHIHRALYLARKAGLTAVGYASPDADVRPAALALARRREVPAAAKAVFVDRF